MVLGMVSACAAGSLLGGKQKANASVMDCTYLGASTCLTSVMANISAGFEGLDPGFTSSVRIQKPLESHPRGISHKASFTESEVVMVRLP